MQLFGQIYLDENELLIGHLGIDKNKHAHFHLFSYPKHSNQELIVFVQKLIADQGRQYLYFAGRFYEMPILVLDESRKNTSSKQLLTILNLRKQLLTSMDSPFNIMKKFLGLWTKKETQMLSTWQHNPAYLDIRTLDGRIDHGELTRLPRYWLEMGLPLADLEQSSLEQLKQNLINLVALFKTDRFQESYEAHNFLLKKYHNEIVKDPHEDWAGMMTIMPMTTDAETIEAILYRDHHIQDGPKVYFNLPTMQTEWGQDLMDFYRCYLGIDINQLGTLSSVHQRLKNYRPPIILNPDDTYLTLMPSENGLHGITINPEKFKETSNWTQANKFSKSIYAPKIYKLESPLLYQQTLLDMHVFDNHAQKTVKMMVDYVFQNGQADLEGLAYYRLLHALKGAGETSFDNHLKQPNNILSMYLQVQTQLISLIEKLILHGINVYSVNSLLLYVALPDNLQKDALEEAIQDTNFEIADVGHDFYAKSANNHFYVSDKNGYQAAGDGVNHFAGPNVYTDQQRPTIVETVFDELLVKKHGNLNSVQYSEVENILKSHLTDFDPKEWMQPILSSPLKEILAIDLKTKRVADPVMRGFYVKSSTKNGTQVQRIYFSNRGNGDAKIDELSNDLHLRDRFNITKKHAYIENNIFYQGRIFLICDDLRQIEKNELKEKLDLHAYADLVIKLLVTWL